MATSSSRCTSPEKGGDDDSFASAHEEDNEEEYYDNQEEENAGLQEENFDEGGSGGMTSPPLGTDEQQHGADSSLDGSSANNNTNINMDETSSAEGGIGGGPCFFADATLDLEEAHGLAETPIASQKGKVDMDIVDVLSDVNLGGGGTGGSGAQQDRSHPLMVVTEENHNLKQDGTSGAVAEDKQRQQLENSNNDGNNTNSIPQNDSSNNNTQPITTKTMNRITSTILGSGTALSTQNPASTAGGYTSSLMVNTPLPNTTSSMETSGAASFKPSNQPTYRPKPPRKPRDLHWALVAVIFIPCSLILPFYCHSSSDKEHQPSGDWYQATYTLQGSLTTTLSTILTTLIALSSCRILYKTPGGGDGDDERHILSKYIVSSSSLSFFLNFVLMVNIYWRCRDAAYYALLPAYFFVKDLIFLNSVSNSTAANNEQEEEDIDGRKTFFRELVCMALDILSRSLRRSSFYRVLSIAMVVQFGLVLIWRSAFFASVQSSSLENSGVGSKIMVLIALLGGKWATGIVARILGLIASGGITSWFAQQSILMEEMERMKSKRLEQQQKAETTAAAAVGSGGDSKDGGGSNISEIDTMSDDYSVGYNNGTRSDAAARAAARAALHAMPEAYRTADASAYRSVIEFDEGMDDDYFDEEEDEDDYYEGEEDSFIGGGGSSPSGGGGGGSSRRRRRSTAWTGGGSGGGSTVKSFLFSGVTVSFGSVAQCGLLGGMAQLVWSIVRNVDAAKLFVSRRLRGGGMGSGFRGMEIGSDGSAGDGGGGQMARIVGGGGGGGRGGGFDFRQSVENWRQTAAVFWNKFDLMARAFVRSHSDLALSHVAAYFKGYNRAANDVAALIEASGVEPIIHDDITTHMCSSVCSAVSGCIVVLFGNIVANHRTIKGLQEDLSDAAVCEIMLVVFIMCYTIMFSVMEPLRASIKAIYVCFAQHPQSLSQAFPLIFHRLSRISEANLV